MKTTKFTQARIDYDNKVELNRKRLMEAGEAFGAVAAQAVLELSAMDAETADFVNSMTTANTAGQYTSDIAKHTDQESAKNELLTIAQGYVDLVKNTVID